MTSDQILESLSAVMGIKTLNEMQQATIATVRSDSNDIMLYSPTGTGKTLAFLFPLLEGIDETQECTQVAIIVPSRELALQISEVARKISSRALKITCCYGGHNSQDESHSLQGLPHIIVATPGRLLDHLNRGNIALNNAKMLVLDEFDKSLELGFAKDMSGIISKIPTHCRKILTSATHIEQIPHFVKLNNPTLLDFSNKEVLDPTKRITMWQVKVDRDDNRLDALGQLLLSLPDERIIIFSNFRETAQVVFAFLTKHKIASVLYHGALEQIEREKAVAMFNNGSALVMSATDLASRGLDITGVKHIIHYHMPLSKEILIHRNGRSARVDECGNAYVMLSPSDTLPPFMPMMKEYRTSECINKKVPAYATMFISAGKKEKISHGDIVGYIASGTQEIAPSEIGKINIFDHYSLVAVPKNAILALIKELSPLKLKKRKVKLSVAKPRL